MKNKAWQASFFLLMFVLNSLFYVSLQTWMPLRSSIYLLPFILLFQAYGLKALIEMVITRFSPLEYRDRYSYLALAAIFVCYFSFFSIGKYRNFEPDSGNPFELARSYLKSNLSPNDLIISSLYDTKGGFYLGDMIRENNLNIYQNGRIENIYYLSPKTGESKIELDMAYPAHKKVKFVPLEKFELVVSYENKGVRPSAVHIYKRKVGLNSMLQFNQHDLSLPEYLGNFGKVCNAQVDGQGIRVKCDNSNISCSNQRLTFSGITKSDLQFVMFHHVNDTGTQTMSLASMKSMDQLLLTEKGRKAEFVDPLPDVYMFNQLVNSINDTDIYKISVNLVDISLQKMGNGENSYFCMVGRLFKGNSLIKGVKVFNWKQ